MSINKLSDFIRDTEVPSMPIAERINIKQPQLAQYFNGMSGHPLMTQLVKQEGQTSD